jgi:hypothetical protein
MPASICGWPGAKGTRAPEEVMTAREGAVAAARLVFMSIAPCRAALGLRRLKCPERSAWWPVAMEDPMALLTADCSESILAAPA